MERARRSVWCLSTYSLTSYLLTYLRPASRGQRGLPHLLQRGRTAAHLAPHALARPGAPSMVRASSGCCPRGATARCTGLLGLPGAASGCLGLPRAAWGCRPSGLLAASRTRDAPGTSRRAAPRPSPGPKSPTGRRSPILSVPHAGAPLAAAFHGLRAHRHRGLVGRALAQRQGV